MQLTRLTNSSRSGVRANRLLSNRNPEAAIRRSNLATVICARPASRYEREIPGALKADVIVSQNSFEHFLDAGGILGQIRSALAPDGRLFITFAPPLYAPWGAHIAFYCRLPWVRLLFPESTVMEVRALFRPDNVRT